MSKVNRDINRLFEALDPTDEQKNKMLARLMRQNQNQNNAARSRGIFVNAKRLRPAIWVAVIMAFLTTTGFAAAYLGLDEGFLKFLKPANHEQAKYLSNGAYVINKRVTNKQGTLTIKQVIGNSNLTYILMDFTAPKGTVLDAARYRFLENDMTIKESYRSTGYEVVPNENRAENTISLVMTIVTKNVIAGQNIHFKLKDLQAAEPYPGEYKTIISGDWETDFKLDFKDYSTQYEVNKAVSMFGYRAILKTISVSPISIALVVESRNMKEIDKAAGPLKEVGPNQSLDYYPITIKYQDGTSETTDLLKGIHLTENGTQLFTVKTFEQVINDKTIASIVFFDREIPINN
ncbi:hypothetical protein [Paenibacillus sp. NPDC058071]|uniref:hypothetical protein n=1 Tax=Paenibacillus sp. NPDC058071 TaxID=3346326 RepID=UPI0036DAE04A